MASKTIKSLDGLVVNTKVLAAIFGVTERRVRQFVEEGIIDRIGQGRYDLHDTLKKYITYLRTIGNVDLEAGKLKENLDKEKYLHEKAKREKAELELEHMKGNLHRSEDVAAVMNKMLGDFRSRVLAMPTKLAPYLVGHSDISEIQDIIRSEVYHVLTELSEYDPQMFGVESSDDDDGDDDGDDDDE